MQLIGLHSPARLRLLSRQARHAADVVRAFPSAA